MPTAIHDAIPIAPQCIKTGGRPNHGVELTTESILHSMEELDRHPEMGELFQFIRQSAQYVPCEQDA